MEEMKTVLFSSDRPLERAENLKAVWDAWDGPKEFVQYIPEACKALSGRYSVFVVDCTPQYSPTKGDVVEVFVGHGITGDKRYGLDFTEDHRSGVSQLDWAICASEYGRMRTASQLGLDPERVLVTGLPITDGYFGKAKGDGGTMLAEYGKAYLYVPTWRPPKNPPLPKIDWEMLDSMMEDDELLVVKRHMCTEGPLVGADYRHVAEVGNMAKSVPYVIDCDVLATDFSSILFDGYILGKPSVLVTDGKDAYQRAHGMYEEYPGFYGSRTVEAEGNEEGFLAALRDAFGKGLGDIERKCVETVAGTCDGHAAERVAELVGRYA